MLQAARVDGCELLLIEDRAGVEQVLELILSATTIEVSDPGAGECRVDLMVRYGHAAPMPRSPRCPVREVIIAA
ncbi:hypothetical protein [Accumulibacter sp.]|uniref:Uncharacterized protein n=1 Tax=Candidatus Accumulibacter proximus TaxID=2954385 RepID=A0A935PYR6_9PROT|nr:hypothetical protein [Accumulibacter sp.]MBK7675809.1 hypothetical protein [Candidatus Accumulibacter proximus]MBL8374048.1 hypothetical protein [Accumulibacter sp.]